MRKNTLYYIIIVLLTITFVTNIPIQSLALTLTAYGQDIYESSEDGKEPQEKPDDENLEEEDGGYEDLPENPDDEPDNNENEDGESIEDEEESENDPENPELSSEEENPAVLEGAMLFLPANFNFSDTLIEADREIKVTADWNLTQAITIGENATVKIYSDPESLATYTITSAVDERHFIVHGTLILDNIILDGNDSFGGIHMESNNDSEPVLELNKSTITNCIITTATSGSVANASGGGIRALAGSTIIMNESTITNCIADGRSGGGISMGSSTLIMNNSIISDCHTRATSTTNGGGGISGSGSITMNGTSCIVDCTSQGSGGGIYISNGTLTINDSSQVKDCSTGYKSGSTYTGGGGGVYLGSYAVFYMNDGTRISGCTAETNGGGVYVSNGSNTPESVAKFYLKNGTIEGNRSQGGGGVYIAGHIAYGIGGTFTEYVALFQMDGGLITHNVVEKKKARNSSGIGYGNGVYADGIFNMFGGTISYNYYEDSGGYVTGYYHGGGVYVSQSAYCTIYDGFIEYNTSYMGGGMSTNTGLITLEGGTIRNNTADNTGGGIFMINGDKVIPINLIMKDGIIENNHAAGRGGGIEVNNDSSNEWTTTAHILGGIIRNNTAGSAGGGISVLPGAVLKIDSLSLYGNTALSMGGGIFVYYYSAFSPTIEIKNTNIIGNHAAEGGGIHVNTFTDPGYELLSIDENTVFWSNTANNAYAPPDNADTRFPKIRYSSTSITEHPINNFDINHTGFPPLPSSGDEDLTIQVISKETGAPLQSVKMTVYISFNGTPFYYSQKSNDDVFWSANVSDAQVFSTNNDGWFTITSLPYNTYSSYQIGTYSGYKPIEDKSIEFKQGENLLIVEAEPLKDEVPSPEPQPEPSEKEDNGTSREKNDDNDITVYFHRNDGSINSIYLKKTVPRGGRVSEPAPPEREGYVFGGWYREKECINAYDFNRSIYEDLHLYAKWIMELPFAEEHYAYIIGYEDGTVRPQANITRAETATIFYRLITDEYRQIHWTNDNRFSDMEESQWHNIAVSTMTHASVVSGYPDNSFRPQEHITRAEFAVIAARFAEGSYSGSDKFNDISGHWAKNYINTAAELGWISGYPDGTFGPDKYITRAEVTSIINRVTNRLPASFDSLRGHMILWPDNMDRNAWYYLDIQEATNSHEYEADNYIEYWTDLRENRNWADIERPGTNPYHK